MKHRALDLKSEIERATLPSGLNGFLFPLFEAISNALHSIEDRFAQEAHEKGQINVTFDSPKRKITVSDNGDGFNERNLEAFLTPFTGNKLTRNGKGFGRFISFKVFQRVSYSTQVELKRNLFEPASYAYFPLNETDNLVQLADGELTPHEFERGLTVIFGEPLPNYVGFFDFQPSEKLEFTEEDVAISVLDHFLLDFVQHKAPKRFMLSINGVTFDLFDYFDSSVQPVLRDSEVLAIEDKETNFDFNYMRVDAEKLKRHSLYFYSDSRATTDLESISKGLKETHFESEGKKYSYLVAVSSTYFTSSQSRDKITNLNVKIDLDGKSKALKDTLVALAKSKILDLEPRYTAERRAVIKKYTEELIALDPVLRRGLGDQTITEFVNARGILESKEQIASDLFVIRLRTKFDFRKINSSTPFDELKRVVREKIPDDAKEALAVYVAYRNDLINVFKEMLSRHTDGLAREDAVHELVYPRYKDSEQIDYSSHNLWLLDDDLAFAEYISSDRTPSGPGREMGAYAHDLLVNNQNEWLLVEMKRPQKKTYDINDEPKHPTDNPIQQLIKQVGQIRDLGKVITSGGRELHIPKDKMVRAYILADWNDRLQGYLTDNDYILTDYGGPMAYRYYSARNLMIEVIAFDRLADRASKRNQVFSQILEGRSDFTGSRVNRLDAGKTMG